LVVLTWVQLVIIINYPPWIRGACICRYISWDDYFMAIAFLSAERSKDPNRQVKYICAGLKGNVNICAGDALAWKLFVQITYWRWNMQRQ
jgi:hypothetical protein